MNGWDIVLAVGGGLAVNEMCDLSPWLARTLVGWAARRRYRADPIRGAIRAEELVAVIDARPGKLTKLLTAVAFAAATAGTVAADTTKRMLSLSSRAGLVVRRVREYQLVLLPLISSATATTTVITDSISHPDHRLGYQGAALIGGAITSSIVASVAQLRHQRRQRARPAGLDTPSDQRD
jgi:hypothetical protein